jgi:hypothetical protein
MSETHEGSAFMFGALLNNPHVISVLHKLAEEAELIWTEAFV